jgi:hypothetical protein
MDFFRFIKRAGVYKTIGSVLILVAFGMVGFCAIAAIVIDLSRVYLERARIDESVEAATMAAARELSRYSGSVTGLDATQENEIKKAAIAFGEKNKITIDPGKIVIAGTRVYIDSTQNITYSFAKIIGYDSIEVQTRRVVDVGRDGKPKVIKQAQYHVMPWGLPHRELDEPYNPANKVIEMSPDGAYDEVDKFEPGREYVLKLGSDVATGDDATPLGAQVLIPMGVENSINDQWAIGYKRAYGLVVWLLTAEDRGGAGIEDVKWLLNYRGGSFMFAYNPAVLTRLGALKLSGDGLFGTTGMFTNQKDADTGRNLFPYVKYQIVKDPKPMIDAAASVLDMTTAPKVGVYSSGEDAVTRALDEAGILYENFYDNGILTGGILNDPFRLTWLYLHHEDFYGGDTHGQVPMISIRDVSGDQIGPHSALLTVRGWNWNLGKEGYTHIRIFFGDRIVSPTLTGTYNGCSTGVDAEGPFVNANDNGNFEITFTIPVKPNGDYFVFGRTIVDQIEDSSNYVNYRVIDSSIIPAITSVNHVTLSNNVASGDLIRVSGSNFGANQPGIVVKFDGIGQSVTKTATFPNCSIITSLINADENGNFEITFPAPDVLDGTHEVYAQIDNTLSNKIIFNVNNYRTPVISISDRTGITDSGPGGSSVFVTGSGFVPNYYGAYIKFNNVTMTVYDTPAYADDWVFGGSTIYTDGEGRFEVRFNVPDFIADGTYEVKAYAGLTSSTEVQLYKVKNAITPEIMVFDLNGDPGMGPAGSELICNGAYFPPLANNIKIRFDSVELELIDTTVLYPDDSVSPSEKTLRSNALGRFEVRCVIPAGLPDGIYNVVALLNNAPISNTVTYKIGTPVFTPTLTIIDTSAPHTSGPATEIITVHGSGFAPATSNLEIFLGDTKMNITPADGYTGSAVISPEYKITTDLNGGFSVKFSVPMRPPGDLFIKAASATVTSPQYPYSVTPISTFYSSINPDFSTNNDSFDRTVNTLMYLKVVSTDLAKDAINQAKFSVECAFHAGAEKHMVSNINLTNNGDYTYTGLFDWSAYDNIHNGVWQVNFYLEDATGKIYNPNKVINVTGTSVATQSSALSINANLSSADYAFANNSTIYYKIQSNVVSLLDITAKTVKFACAANWYGLGGGAHFYNLPALTNNMDETYNGSYNLSALGALHYGMWVLNLKIQDSFPKVYEVIKEVFLFSSNSELRAIISDNKYFGETYDIKHDGKRSDTNLITPYPVFNSNGKLYIVFNAAPAAAASKVNYSSVTTSDFKLEFSEFVDFPADSYKNNPSVVIEKRGMPMTVSTALFNLSNNSNGLFTAEIDLTSAGITSVRRSFDLYFRVTMRVIDTAFVTAQITTCPHQIDYSNSQVPAYVHLNKTAPDKFNPFDNFFKYMKDNYGKAVRTANANVAVEKSISRVNNSTPSLSDSKSPACSCHKNAAAKDGFLSNIFNNYLKPASAMAGSYSGKYQVVHKIREWVVNGGYMFTMCCATDTIDRVLACDEAGNPLLDYNYTFAFTGFNPTKDAPKDAGAIDAYDGPMTLGNQIFTLDRLKRPLAITQSHQQSFPAFSGTTSAFKTQFVKTTTGPNDSMVNILAYVGNTTSEVKYLGAEYGNGWFSFLGGHDPRFVSTYRLILDNVLIGSFSTNNPPNATSISYGTLDWNNTNDGYSEDEKDYKASVLYGCGQPLFGEITLSYPGDIATTPLVDSIPYCFEEATRDAVAKRYSDDIKTPRAEGKDGERTCSDFEEGSSRYVLVPIVTNYYTNGSPVYTSAQNLFNTPKYIYKIVGRDKVRIKRYALFFLSGNNAKPNADPVYNEVGALRHGEVRAKFIGYLK